jgi:hypothetical protein
MVDGSLKALTVTNYSHFQVLGTSAILFKVLTAKPSVKLDIPNSFQRIETIISSICLAISYVSNSPIHSEANKQT